MGVCCRTSHSAEPGCCFAPPTNSWLGQDDRDVPTQSCPDKWKPRQGGEKEIHASASFHIAPLEKGKDIGCEGGGAEGEGGEGGECNSDARIRGTCQPRLPDSTSKLPNGEQLQARGRGGGGLPHRNPSQPACHSLVRGQRRPVSGECDMAGANVRGHTDGFNQVGAHCRAVQRENQTK